MSRNRWNVRRMLSCCLFAGYVADVKQWIIWYNDKSTIMSEEIKITFLPVEKSITVSPGQNVLEAAMRAGVHINASCSGNGVCGKCKVKIIEGIVEHEPSARLDRHEYDTGVRLACRSIPQMNAVIEVPLESQIEKSFLKRSVSDHHISHEFRYRDAFDDFCLNPLVRKLYMELPAPTMEDNISDWNRLIRGFGDRGHRKVIFESLDIMRNLGRVLREGNWKVTVTLAERGDADAVTAVGPGNEVCDIYAIAVDVGTTTVCGRLFRVSPDGNSCSGQECGYMGAYVAESADYNGQIGFGEDVISRIMYARKEGGLQKLQNVVMKTINTVIHDLLSQGKISLGKISHIVLAGNTTMTHMVLGVDPTYIMLAPYTPVTNMFPRTDARSLGIDLEGHVDVYTMPCVASYMGGDIVSGVLASKIRERENVSLFMDIGTNGEIVLGCNEWLLSASCSAGPAFEGGGIEFGMRASAGAIERVKIHPATCEPMILTVGRGKPIGICGSGLIDLVAGLLETGLIDPKGKFVKEARTERVREGHGCREYVICYAPETAINRDIVITEIDIDNLVRTKAAIFAGCRILLNNVGLSFNDLEYVIIAGGFGHYLDLEKAKMIGLLPELADEKFRFIGNSSLTGAHLASLDRNLWIEAHRIAGMMTNIELSNNGSFMDEYIAAMFFPHTEMYLFPETTERLRNV